MASIGTATVRTVNVPRWVLDPLYTYKMPELMISVEGEGTDAETVLVNIEQIARALHRPASYPTKFMAISLGVRDTSELEFGRFAVSGAHTFARLAALLDSFIARYVLCRCCSKIGTPETEIMASRDPLLVGVHCHECDHITLVSGIRKMDTFIAHHPPSASPNPVRSPAVTAPLPADADAADGDGGDCADGGDDWTIDTSDEAVAARMAETLPQPAARPSRRSTSGETEASEPGPQRASSPEDEAWLRDVALAASRGDVASVERLSHGPAPRACPALFSKAVCLVAASFDAGVLRQVVPRAPALRPLTDASPEARATLIWSLASLCLHIAETRAAMPAVLQFLYDKDVLGEDDVLGWRDDCCTSSPVGRRSDDKEARRQFLEAAAPFIQWLEEDEEEDSGNS